MARVLIVEDDDIVGEVVSGAFLDAGHSAGRVADGDQALRAILTQRPDIAVLDHDLPGTDGVSILRGIRDHPELWQMPVLMMTSHRAQSEERWAIHMGANGYLRKPCDPDYVVYRVEEQLARRRPC